MYMMIHDAFTFIITWNEMAGSYYCVFYSHYTTNNFMKNMSILFTAVSTAFPACFLQCIKGFFRPILCVFTCTVAMYIVINELQNVFWGELLLRVASLACVV